MDIKWLEKNGKKYLHFLFEEHLTEQSAKDGIQKWQSQCAGYDNKIRIIWDCTLMKGYDTQARVTWHEALKEMKNSIEVIWLVSTSPLIRMGASIMSMLMPFKIIAVSSEQEIK